MFTLSLNVNACQFEGLKALDMRRRLNLGDNVYIRIVNSGSTWIKVSEEFARKHFDDEQVRLSFHVDASLLKPNELVATDKEATVFKLSDSIPADRVLDLFYTTFPENR